MKGVEIALPKCVHFHVARSTQGIPMSPTTMKRLKRAVRLATDLSPVAPLAPTAHWLFYERKHPHSLWHGDCLEKVRLPRI